MSLQKASLISSAVAFLGSTYNQIIRAANLYIVSPLSGGIIINIIIIINL